MRVLCVSDYFAPGFLGGGPITTLVNMRKGLKASIEFWVFTRDRDLGANSSYQDVMKNCWVDTSDGPVFYATPNLFGPQGVLQVFSPSKFDIVYLNSFFSLRGSILLLLAFKTRKLHKRILIAPRGEFSSGALAVKKFKKWLFLSLARLSGIYKDVFWHASTGVEADDILCQFPNAAKQIYIAADPLSNNVVKERGCSSKTTGHLRMVFISRISPMKNLDGLLITLSTVKGFVELDIFGPSEDMAYWSYCQSLIEKMPPNITVRSCGPLVPAAILDTFARYDLFAFPTHGENFGHVIFESLLAGTPVIISDKTSWQSDNTDAVTIVPLCNSEQWREAVQCAVNRAAEDQEEIQKNARRYAEQYLLRTNSCSDTLTMFNTIFNC